jgi:hypothetical protein
MCDVTHLQWCYAFSLLLRRFRVIPLMSLITLVVGVMLILCGLSKWVDAQSNVVSAITAPKNATPTAAFSYTGIIADVLCVNQRIALDGADMLLNPEAHSLHCLVEIPACYAQPYCLMQQNPVTQQWGCAYTFTQPETLAIRTRLMQLSQDFGKRSLWIIVRGTWASSSATTMAPDIDNLVFSSAPATAPSTTRTSGQGTPPAPSAAASSNLLIAVMLSIVAAVWATHI